MAVLVRPSLPHDPIPLQTTLQAVAVRILSPTPFTICNIYLPPLDRPSHADLQSLLSQCPAPILLVGDVNARCPAWGSDVLDRRGSMLESLFIQTPLSVLNTGAPTHLDLHRGTTSSIDVSVASPPLVPFLSWSTLDDLHDSDHFPILISLDHPTLHPPKAPIPRPPRWLLRRANWEKFVLIMSNLRLPDLPLEEAVHAFSSALIEAASESIPKSSSRPHNRPPVPWWSPECEEASRYRKWALRKFKRRPNSKYRAVFEASRREARTILRTHKRNLWAHYISSLTVFTPASEVWRKIRNILGKARSPPPPFLRQGDSVITDPTAIATAFGEYYASLASPPADPPQSHIIPPPDLLEKAIPLNSPLSLRELKMALRQLKSTAPGPDNIPPQLLQHLPRSSLTSLLDLFNRSFEQGTIPTLWRHSIVLPILKKDKSPGYIEHYRPISLTSQLGKLMERMILHRFSYFLESNELLSSSQHGFRRGRSAMEALAELGDAIATAFEKRNILAAVFFDFARAFDTVLPSYVLGCLVSIGVHGRLLEYFRSFLSPRPFQVRIGSESSPTFLSHRGTPQGSILSPILFLLAIDGVTRLAPPPLFKSPSTPTT